MIPQSQISKLSNRLLKENSGRRIRENILERDCRVLRKPGKPGFLCKSQAYLNLIMFIEQ